MAAAESVHFDIHVTGKVQGVWFRKSAVQQAWQSGITGYAMNRDDGSVFLEAEGPREALETFVAWCRIGPPKAHVENVEVTEGPVQGHTVFETRY
jgi:acylphosphatase